MSRIFYYLVTAFREGTLHFSFKYGASYKMALNLSNCSLTIKCKHKDISGFPVLKEDAITDV